MAGVLLRLKRSFKLRFPRVAAAGSYVRGRKKRFLALTITVAHVVGALTSVQAIMNTRTAQGAVAWAVSLNTFPYLAVPAYFLQLIGSARERIWIASPYFVPDEQLISALELAALRGVEVRILIPDHGDSALVDLSGWAYVERLGKVGVHFYRHTKDFMHQKVTLVDSDLATVGSANFDNRSFRLNFEMTMEVRDRAFAGEAAAMLEKDFAHARPVDPGEARDRGFLFELKVRSAILLSPIQ